jgi:hypothetical protein
MLKRLPVSTILVSGMLFALAALGWNHSSINGLAMMMPQQMQGEDAIAALPDGSYQLCSKPDPSDWRDGAGVCFIFKKTDQGIEGYYGYPNSDSFMCIRGAVKTNRIQGEGLAISWPGLVWDKIPDTESTWDAEGHLKITQGKIIRSVGKGEDRVDWLYFHQVVLDVNHFYHYRSPRMNPPSSLCDWKTIP